MDRRSARRRARKRRASESCSGCREGPRTRTTRSAAIARRNTSARAARRRHRGPAAAGTGAPALDQGWTDDAIS